jgi:N utilization substance protein A
LEIREDEYRGSRIIVSRATPFLVEKLFEKEVPEIASGTVKIKKVVREGGDRSKIAVFSDQPGIDPVGACVGQKGIRVKSVTDELGGDEKVDIIQYHEDDTFFIREALSPAKVTSVEIDAKAKRAKVFVDEEQAPLAIGRGGVNVNLASRLTEYELDIVQTEKKEDKKPKEVDEEIEANESTAVDPFLEETSKNAVNVEATEKKTKKKNTKKTDTE